MKNICMHSKSIISSETTGSLVVELIDGEINIFATGSSLPCLSIYKPLWFVKNPDLFYSEDEVDSAVNYWKRQKETIEQVAEGNRDRTAYLENRDRIERELFELARSARDELEREEIIKRAWGMM